MARNSVLVRAETADITDTALQIGSVTLLAFVWTRQVRNRVFSTAAGNDPTIGVIAGRIKNNGVVTGIAAAPDGDHKEQYNKVVKYLHRIIS
jgi:hypothetical protein